jgi:hypothetical protein
MSQVISWWVWFHSLCALVWANLQFWHPYRVLFIRVANIRHSESNYSGAPDNIRIHNTVGHTPSTYEPFKSSMQNHLKACLQLHPPWLCENSCTIYSVIVLHLILYFLLLHSLPHSPTLDLHYSKWNLRPARWGITMYRTVKKHTQREHSRSRKQPICIAHQLFAFQLSGLV